MKLNTLCIIPARSGSKGIRNKNLKKINNISLIGHAVKCAIKSKIFSDIVISTDSKRYGSEAEKFGGKFLFLRSKKLSGSCVGDIDVLYDALKKTEIYTKKKYDFIAMLQPTCPTRKPIHIIRCFKKISKNKLDTVWTVTKVDKKYHPLKILTKVENENFKNYISKGKKIIARQQLGDVYIRNGACYFFNRKNILNKNLYGKKNYLEIIKEEMTNIDNHSDLVRARKAMIIKNK